MSETPRFARDIAMRTASALIAFTPAPGIAQDAFRSGDIQMAQGALGLGNRESYELLLESSNAFLKSQEARSAYLNTPPADTIQAEMYLRSLRKESERLARAYRGYIERNPGAHPFVRPSLDAQGIIDQLKKADGGQKKSIIDSTLARYSLPHSAADIGGFLCGYFYDDEEVQRLVCTPEM